MIESFATNGEHCKLLSCRRLIFLLQGVEDKPWQPRRYGFTWGYDGRYNLQPTNMRIAPGKMLCKMLRLMALMSGLFSPWGLGISEHDRNLDFLSAFSLCPSHEIHTRLSTALLGAYILLLVGWRIIIIHQPPHIVSYIPSISSNLDWCMLYA